MDNGLLIGKKLFSGVWCVIGDTEYRLGLSGSGSATCWLGKRVSSRVSLFRFFEVPFFLLDLFGVLLVCCFSLELLFQI